MTLTTSDAEALAPWAIPEECWAEDDRAVLICRQVLDITHDVKSFHFAAEDGRIFRYDPGQFITLEVEINGRTVNRCYTISSPPTRPNVLAITVKRVPGGPVSNWLHDNVVAGTRLTVLAPLGHFSMVHRPAKKYLFMSAGSGITPMMSMTRTLCDLGSDTDITFLHNARTPADIIFRRELEAIAATMPNVRVVHMCEADYPSERWMGLRGRVTAAALEAVVPDLAERVVFTCGPAPYMAAVQRVLESIGFDMRNYNEESFSFESLPADERSRADESSHTADDDGNPAEGGTKATATFTVEFVRSGKTVAIGADEKVLDAAVAAGLRIPSSCSQGMCGTCKTTMLEGDVDMRHNGGIRPKEVAQGKFLPCCSTPLSNLRIDA